MADIDFTEIKGQVADLAKSLFTGFADQARRDGVDFVESTKDKFVRRTEQLRRGEISETNYKNGMLNLAALAKMERLKQQGLAKIAIDKFTNGVIDILISAALKAI